MVGLISQVIALGVGLAAGTVWPRVQQPLWRKDVWVNLMNGLLLYPVRLALGALGVYQFRVGLVPLSFLNHPALQLLFCFLVLDFGRYWLHYAHHRVPFLWSFHRVHHSVESMDATAGLRMHAVDFLQLGLLPVFLFGIIFDTSQFPAWILPVAMVPGVLFDSFEHANLRFDASRGWRRAWHRLLNNPLFHSWHHTNEGHLCDGNYGNVLLLWDRLFGTEVTREQPPAEYGLSPDQRLRNGVIDLQLLRLDR